MATANPFAAVDFSKYMAEMKVPMFDVNKVVAAQQKNLDALTAVNNAAAAGARQVFERQVAIARDNVAELTEILQALAAEGAPDAKVARQAELTKEGYERAVANLKELNAVMAKANNAVFDLLSKRFVEGLDEVKGLVESAAK